MSTAENVALERRLEAIANAIGDVRLLYIRTTLVVCERPRVPERYYTVAEVLAAAGMPPQVHEVEEIPDLELLIDRLTGERWLRHTLDAEGQAAFDAEKHAAELLDVRIRGHAKQIAAIRSRAPLVVIKGGNRSGKSETKVWRLFRRWMLRGQGTTSDTPAALFWWVAPDLDRAIRNGAFLLMGPHAAGRGRWPDKVFAALVPISKTAKRTVERELVDGSRLAFMHANTRGESAGDNLKSVNVTDAVVDELGAIPAEESWHQVNIRTIQTGGSVTTGTTPKPRKAWVRDVVSREQIDAGVAEVYNFTMVDNPWVSIADLLQGFLKDRTLTPAQVERDILPAADYMAALRATVTSRRARIEHFGEDIGDELLLWTEWADDLIYPTLDDRHAAIFVRRGDRPERLINITTARLAQLWQRQTAEGRGFARWGGLDFNVLSHSVVFEIFGRGETIEQALADRASWTVLVVSELEVEGTTMEHAARFKSRFGLIPCYADPHGAAGHVARGTNNAGRSDVAAWRAEGYPIQYAAGVDQAGRPKQLSRADSCNVLHHLMRDGRLLVSDQCTGLIEALRHEEVGTKRSSPDSLEDRRSGYTDAMRYGLWQMFRHVVVAREATA